MLDRVLDELGQQVEPGTEGAICIRLPMPPGTLPTLWQADDRYVAEYLSAFDGYYLTGDGGYIDEDGYLFVMGRTDDIINVAGHRLSTGAMEEVLASHPDVAECAVIGHPDEERGQIVKAFVVLRAGAAALTLDDLRAFLADKLGRHEMPASLEVRASLPHTPVGKLAKRDLIAAEAGRIGMEAGQ